MGDERAFAEGLKSLREGWLARLPPDLARLAEAVASIELESVNPRSLEVIHGISHRIAGSGQTFGYTALGNAARALEALARTVLEAGEHPSGAAQAQLAAAWAALDTAAREPLASQSPVVPDAVGGAGPATRAIYVVDDDPTVASEIALQLCHFGYRARTFGDLPGFRAAVLRELPAAVVMDLAFQEGALAGAEVVQELSVLRAKNIPVLFVSGRTDMAARLCAVRAGGSGYFPKPINSSSLIAAIEGQVNPGGVAPLRVLVVDDDGPLAEAYALALREGGAVANVVTNPNLVVVAIADMRPDLILMDLHFSDCTGVELASIIRQEPANVGVPIYFVSSHVDSARQMDVLRCGGDEFIAKPISPSDLSDQVLARARRIRAVQGHLAQDGLTGLLNHLAVRSELEREVARSRRERRPVSVVMIDLDNFKTINDSMGHLAGDRVLRNLSWLLRQRLRRSDLVGRYGGEEFLAILPGADAQTAHHVIDNLRAAFANQGQGADGIRVTFSAGVSAFPDFAAAGRLIDAADRALYAAKRGGKNRVELASM